MRRSKPLLELSLLLIVALGVSIFVLTERKQKKVRQYEFETGTEMVGIANALKVYFLFNTLDRRCVQSESENMLSLDVSLLFEVIYVQNDRERIYFTSSNPRWEGEKSFVDSLGREYRISFDRKDKLLIIQSLGWAGIDDNGFRDDLLLKRKLEKLELSEQGVSAEGRIQNSEAQEEPKKPAEQSPTTRFKP